MDNGEHATTFDMSKFWNKLPGHDCNDKGSTSLAKLLNRAGGHSNSSDMLPELQDLLHSKGAKQNC
ncbi:hypothetical protein F2Q69_00021920 [Brassica cretica]|uniref:Uncharacterized protein n=1 Tax=Brassica cretica TaxID=69181 RepID=A0A8S9Q5T3_BRACR|nr:hypothetical protein F2Q69_00021920 [Brassica cretica]